MKINIVDYDPTWPTSFERIKQELAVILALGPVPYVDIHHVGSTSVPGLAAKPIIDIDIVVPVSHLSAAASALSLNGYTYNPEPPSISNPRFDRFSFRFGGHTHDQGASRPTEDEEIRRAVYTNSPQGESLRLHLEVRDCLRRHAGLREEYDRAKRDLAETEHESIGHYAAGKSEVLEKVILHAQKDKAEADDRVPE
jgi:GrpB-like predicted nucleotidyltransferase (UPF0157 family)